MMRLRRPYYKLWAGATAYDVTSGASQVKAKSNSYDGTDTTQMPTAPPVSRALLRCARRCRHGLVWAPR